MRARDIMTTDPLVVEEGMAIEELCGVLAEEKVTGGQGGDAEGRLVG